MGYLDKEGLIHFWGQIKTALSVKQDKLTGAAGQVVGFDAAGHAVAQDTSESVTMEQVNAAIAAAVTGAMEASY